MPPPKPPLPPQPYWTGSSQQIHGSPGLAAQPYQPSTSIGIISPQIPSLPPHQSSSLASPSQAPDIHHRWSLPPQGQLQSSSAPVPPPPPGTSAFPVPVKSQTVSPQPSTAQTHNYSIPPHDPHPQYPYPAHPQQQSAIPSHRSQPIQDLLDEEIVEEQPVTSNSASPAPARPPNPELLDLHARAHGELTSELAMLTRSMSLDAERLRAQQADLLAGMPAIQDEMARLEAVRDVCRGVVARLGNTVGQAERNVSELKRKGDPPVDELVCSTSIVHNQ